MQLTWKSRPVFPALTLTILVGICDAQSLPDRLQQVVQPYVDAGMFMGSVMVAQHGKVLFSKSYGWADVEWKIPNSSTARFQIASVTKQFTAAAILLLEERGKLKTDDLVRKYLPDAPAAWDVQYEFSKNEKGEFVFLTERFNGMDDRGTRK